HPAPTLRRARQRAHARTRHCARTRHRVRRHLRVWRRARTNDRARARHFLRANGCACVRRRVHLFADARIGPRHRIRARALHRFSVRHRARIRVYVWSRACVRAFAVIGGIRFWSRTGSRGSGRVAAGRGPSGAAGRDGTPATDRRTGEPAPSPQGPARHGREDTWTERPHRRRRRRAVQPGGSRTTSDLFRA
ncbi:hypothetical protein, partial [Actinomadura harenae]|uniref:hypothetical protein n=1 Tax=Actinomadura harenae TaxID=2483351 RepID=UPI00360FE145